LRICFKSAELSLLPTGKRFTPLRERFKLGKPSIPLLPRSLPRTSSESFASQSPSLTYSPISAKGRGLVSEGRQGRRSFGFKTFEETSWRGDCFLALPREGAWFWLSRARGADSASRRGRDLEFLMVEIAVAW